MEFNLVIIFSVQFVTNISIIPWLTPSGLLVNKCSRVYSVLGLVFVAIQTKEMKETLSLFSRNARPQVECSLEVSNGVPW